MAGISTYAGNLLLNGLLGGAAATMPSARYISLHTADPGLTGASEATGSGYSRQALTWNAASSWAATNAGTASQTLSGALGPITYLGLWDASTGGNFLFGWAVTASKTYANGDTWSIAAAAETLSLT